MKGGKVKVSSGQETLTEVVAVIQVWVKECPREWKEGTQMRGYRWLYQNGLGRR